MRDPAVSDRNQVRSSPLRVVRGKRDPRYGERVTRWAAAVAGVVVLGVWWAAAAPAVATATGPPRAAPLGPVLGIADPACRLAYPNLHAVERGRRADRSAVPRWCHPALN